MPNLTRRIVADVHEVVRRNAVCLEWPALVTNVTSDAYLINRTTSLADDPVLLRICCQWLAAESPVPLSGQLVLARGARSVWTGDGTIVNGSQCVGTFLGREDRVVGPKDRYGG